MKKFLLIAVVLASMACSNEEGAQRALLDAGYTHINILGYSWMGCGENDQYHDEFTAIGPTGRQVHGVVCSGVWKGATIRSL